MTSLRLLVPVAALLLLTSCSSGGDQDDPAPEQTTSSAPSDSPTDSAGDGPPLPTTQLCAGLDVADLGAALGDADLRVVSDVVAGEVGASGSAVLAPQCSLRGGGRTLDLSVFSVGAAGSLREDVEEGVQASEDQGLQTCEDLTDLDAFDGREAVEYDCELPSIQLTATTVVVRMAPGWRVSCSLSGGGLDQDASRSGLEAACGVLVDSLG